MTSLAEQYLDAVQAGLTGLEQQLSSIAAAATRAAERACAGGRVWILSDEEGFVSELQHRASGLMMMKGIPGGEDLELDDAVSAGDVVLAGTQDNATERQGAMLDGLAERGVAVTLIGSAHSPLRPEGGRVRRHRGCRRAARRCCPTAMRPSAPWPASSTSPPGGSGASSWPTPARRSARRRCFLMSGGLATGRDRNQQHEGKAFHDPGEYTIVPSPAGQKGRELLSEWLRCLVGIRATELGRIAEIGAVAAATRAAGHSVWCASIGHNLHSQRGLAGDPGFFRLIFPERGREGRPAGRRLLHLQRLLHLPRTTSYPPPARPWSGRHGSWAARRSRPSTPTPARLHVNAYWRYGGRQHQPAGLRRPGRASVRRADHGHALAPARRGRRPHPRLRRRRADGADRPYRRRRKVPDRGVAGRARQPLLAGDRQRVDGRLGPRPGADRLRQLQHLSTARGGGGRHHDHRPPPLPCASPEPEAARHLLPGSPYLRSGRRGVPAGAQPGLRGGGTGGAAAPRQPPPPHRHRPADRLRRPGQVDPVRELRARSVPDRALRAARAGARAQLVRAGHRAPARGGRRLRRCLCRHRPLLDLPAVVGRRVRP